MTMVTIGTGIGVATLIDGKIQRSSLGVHGEGGHMVLNPFGEKCYCGAQGCWEVLASGTALERRASDLAANPASLLRKMAGAGSEGGNAELLFAAAAAGDSAALNVIEEVATWWGLGLVNLASTVMPDVFVLSGGVMGNFESARARVREVLDQHSTMIPTNVPLAVATLGDDAGAIGAAKSALDLLQGPSH
jgi:glucokinase